MRLLSACLLALLLSSPALADEGQWPPGMLQDLDPARLKQMGLQISTKSLWSEDGGLLRAVVNYGGCTGAFISTQGLVATNHHCAYGALQAASSVDHDYLKEGFVAATRDDEIPAKGRNTLWVLLRIEDVTAQVRRAAAQAKDDAGRKLAVEKTSLAIAEACEARTPGRRCDVKSFFYGARFELHESLELKDLRVVFAPPSSVGEYGGEVDNWMWPRHSADFALLRAYVGPDGQPAEPDPKNVPYVPEQVFEVGHEGVQPEDFVAVLGYPGRTQRYLWAEALDHHVQHTLPGIIDLYGEWLKLLRLASAGDRQRAIKVAALKKGLANRHKNARGMLEGIERMGLLNKRQAEAQAMLRWVKKNKDLEGAQTLAELKRMSQAQLRMSAQDLLLDHVSRGPRLLWVAMVLVRRAELVDVPDAERPVMYQSRNEARLKKRVDRAVADYDPEVEGPLLAAWLHRADALPAHARLPGADRLKQLLKVPPERRAQALLHGNLMRDPKLVTAVFNTPGLKGLENLQDGLVKLALTLRPEVTKQYNRRRTHAGALIRLAPDYLRMLKAVRSGPLYPDANGTLRVSVAQVRGYAPRDGLLATPQTTLQGQIAKHTGEAPFNLPERVREAATAGAASYLSDPHLEDLPVCFLSNGDTTGGNSGSPVIDGKGRWVGLNFDRVWENIAGDVAYNPPQSRNVSVDVRYILWLLSITPGAEPLLTELGVAEVLKQPRRAAAPKAPAAQPGPAPADKAEPRKSCTCTSTPAAAGTLALALVVPLLMTLGRRRRR